jgi:hypothetical protein
MNSYTKLKSGEWGVKVFTPSQVPDEGQRVQVTTKAGVTKSEWVARVLWSGTDRFANKTVHLCTIQPRIPAASQHSGGGGSWTGCSCGSIEGNPRSSDCASCRHDY